MLFLRAIAAQIDKAPREYYNALHGKALKRAHCAGVVSAHSAFGGRSRGRSGSFGVDPNYSYEYHIYVHKNDYENALRLIR